MKRFYSIIALATLVMGLQAQVTYDFTTVVTAQEGGTVNPQYGEGNNLDHEFAYTIHSKTNDVDIPMIKLVAPDGTDYDGRFAIHNRGKSWIFRNTADGIWRGLWSQYNNRYLAIRDLNPGDVITLVMSPTDGTTGFIFDDKDLDQDEVGHYIGNAKAEGSKEITFSIYDGLTEKTDLILISETGIYLEKITITSAGDSGIQDVTTTVKANGQWYNIQGIKVVAPEKGIYIRNGKKVLF